MNLPKRKKKHCFDPEKLLVTSISSVANNVFKGILVWVVKTTDFVANIFAYTVDKVCVV